MAIAVEVIGWIGAVLVLIAYISVSTGKLSGSSPAFHWLNATGAGCFILNTWWHGALPSMALNIIWSGIGFVALFRMWRRRTV